MVYEGIAEYLYATWGITEFWLHGRRILRTIDEKWISIK